ncbi:MAG: hypothetical protein AAB893_02695, partial [Patescibacteria group bacterium]
VIAKGKLVDELWPTLVDESRKIGLPDPYTLNVLPVISPELIKKRNERMARNALFLAAEVEKGIGNYKDISVVYPGLQNHPQYAMVQEQLNGYSGSLIYLSISNPTLAISMFNNLDQKNIIKHGTSYGHNKTRMEMKFPDQEKQNPIGIRISVGEELTPEILQIAKEITFVVDFVHLQ